MRLGVLGAGLMGAGIADVSLNKAKLKVLLKDATEAGIARGEKQISDNLDKSVKRRIMNQVGCVRFALLLYSLVIFDS